MRALLVSAALLAGFAVAAAQDSAPSTRKAAGASRPRARSQPTSVSRPATTSAATLPTTLDECRRLLMSGDYLGAGVGYSNVAVRSRGSDAAAQATIGLAQASMALGKYTEAIDVLEGRQHDDSANPAWHLAMAEATLACGRLDDAMLHAKTARDLAPKSAQAVLMHGRLLEIRGRKKQALEVYRTVENIVAGDEYRNDAPALVALGEALDRFSVLAGRKASEQAANILHNYLQEAYQRVDASYWPAHVAAGQFLARKHNWREAVEEFKLALKANPSCTDAMCGIAVAALEEWQFEACIAQVEQALRVNPNHAEALLIKATCMLQWRKLDAALAAAQRVLKFNPNHLEALSLAAAAHVRLRQDDKAREYADRVAQINPEYEGLPNTIGEWLAAARQFAAAEREYKKAIALAPEAADPLTNLGLLYMQMGEEDKAAEVLEKAHAIDDFRVDVRNYMRLLQQLKGFAVKETDHFIVKVDPRFDAVLLEPVSQYMESIYATICGDFQHEPAAKTIIEIFPEHEAFSVRITGRGWIGTIGAATGRVIVLVAPNAQRGSFGTFNWGVVLRHEFTHTVTLDATGYLVPHWFTEACAVWQQPDRMNYEAVQMLVMAVRQGRLFPIRELDWGFIRPRRNGDRSLAYAQAEWVLEYIIAQKDFDAVVTMLRAFGAGKSQAQVFAEVLGVSETQFDRDFARWASEQVAQWGFDPAPILPPDAARIAAASRPSSAPAQAQLARSLLAAGDIAGAQAAAQRTLAIDAENVKAAEVLALSLVAQKKHDQAIAAAKRLEALDHASRVAPRVLADCYLAANSLADAIPALELLKARAPLDPYSYQRLADLYGLAQPAKALPNLQELHRRTLRDPQYARRIADIYRAMGQEEQALRYYESITQIDPYEASAYQAMAAIYRNMRQFEQAAGAVARVTLIEPASADAWTSLAMMQYLWGKEKKDAALLQQARQAAGKAMELDPQCQAADVMELIDAVERELGSPTTMP